MPRINLPSSKPPRLRGISLSKRLLDLALTVPGLILISPVLLVIAGLSWLLQGRPILFRQVRPGYRAAPFTLYKFRTMTEGGAHPGDPRPDAERLTASGDSCGPSV